MMGQDPAYAKAQEMIRGKNPDEVMQIVHNLAQSQGVNLEDLKRQIGF